MPKTKITIELDSSLIRMLKFLAKESDRTLDNFVNFLLKKFVDDYTNRITSNPTHYESY